MNTWELLALCWACFLAGWLGRSCFLCHNCELYIELLRKLIRHESIRKDIEQYMGRDGVEPK